MWISVVLCNLAIAIVCWRVVFGILRFRLGVANFRQTIVNAEQNCRSNLSLAPDSLWIVQAKMNALRQWQHQGKSQWLRLKKGWQILLWGQRFIQIQSQRRSKADRF